jgi:hypothetical protein
LLQPIAFGKLVAKKDKIFLQFDCVLPSAHEERITNIPSRKALIGMHVRRCRYHSEVTRGHTIALV